MYAYTQTRFCIWKKTIHGLSCSGSPMATLSPPSLIFGILPPTLSQPSALRGLAFLDKVPQSSHKEENIWTKIWRKQRSQHWGQKFLERETATHTPQQKCVQWGMCWAVWGTRRQCGQSRGSSRKRRWEAVTHPRGRDEQSPICTRKTGWGYSSNSNRKIVEEWADKIHHLGDKRLDYSEPVKMAVGARR
jgi:hypothetical protein